MSSRQRVVVPVLLLVIAFVSPVLPAQAVGAAHHVVSIAKARTMQAGSVVTVAGTVTTPPGAFESSFFDEGFGLQDRSAGIYVSVAAAPDIDLRSRVRVTGTLRDSFGLLVLVPSDPAMITVHGRGPAVRPRLLTSGAVGESTEGSLVRVVATITQAPAPDAEYGFKFYVDDGSGELTIFVNTQTGIDLSGLGVGQTVRVTGFSSQFDTHYEIDPRFPRDITVVHP